MASKEELDKGVGAHGMWKTRLKNAINSGTLDVPVEVVRADNQCAFGKWLYSLGASEQSSVHFSTVKNLHGRFHNAAASVAELALAGKKSEATKSIEEGEYSKASNDLTLAMMAWKRSL